MPDVLEEMLEYDRKYAYRKQLDGWIDKIVERDKRVLAAIARLPPEQRDVFNEVHEILRPPLIRRPPVARRARQAPRAF